MFETVVRFCMLRLMFPFIDVACPQLLPLGNNKTLGFFFTPRKLCLRSGLTFLPFISRRETPSGLFFFLFIVHKFLDIKFLLSYLEVHYLLKKLRVGESVCGEKFSQQAVFAVGLKNAASFYSTGFGWLMAGNKIQCIRFDMRRFLNFN